MAPVVEDKHVRAVVYVAYFALAVLLFPVLIISLVLYCILLLPFAVAVTLHIVNPLIFDLWTYGEVVHTLVEDARSVVEPEKRGFRGAVKVEGKPVRTVDTGHLTPTKPPVTRMSSFISDFNETFETDLPPSEPSKMNPRTRPRSSSTMTQLDTFLDGATRFTSRRSSAPLLHTPGKPFDLTNAQFSPHWSAKEKFSTWSPDSTPPLRLKLNQPAEQPLWPSPVPELHPSPGRQSPDSAAEHENFSPIRSPVRAVAQARGSRSPVESQAPVDNKKHVSLFSTDIPDIMRSVGQKQKKPVADAKPFKAPPFMPNGELFSAADISKMPPQERKKWITRFAEMISDLETQKKKQPLDKSLQLSPTRPASPPQRPSAIPHNRDIMDFKQVHAKGLGIDRRFHQRLMLPRPAIPSPGSSPKSPGSEGLYGAEQVEPSYWQGFDQSFGNQSFGSLTSDDGYMEHWRVPLGKWEGKGVKVMKPLDEESGESNSGASAVLSLSTPPSKKGVKWRDQAAPSSPVADVIPRHLEPSLMQEHKQSHETKVVTPEKRIPQPWVENAHINTPPTQAVERPHTPVRVAQVLGKTSNSRDLVPLQPPAPSSVNSPLSVNSPAGSVSGKLIQLFEEMSKPEQTRTSSAASKSSVGTDPTKTMTENVSTGKTTSFSDGMDGAEDEEDTNEELDNEEPDHNNNQCVWIEAGSEPGSGFSETGSLRSRDGGRNSKRVKWVGEVKARTDGYDECF